MPVKPAAGTAVPSVTVPLPLLLRRLFVDERRSDREIAAALGVHRVTVTRWRARYGISPGDRRGIGL